MDITLLLAHIIGTTLTVFTIIFLTLGFLFIVSKSACEYHKDD